MASLENKQSDMPDSKITTRAGKGETLTQDELDENFIFSDDAPVPQAVGGVQAGEIIQNTDIHTLFRKILYPDTPPQAAINLNSISNPIPGDVVPLVKGNLVQKMAPGADISLDLSWSVSQGTGNITSITVAGNPVSPSGGNQSGTATEPLQRNVDENFSINVQDDTPLSGSDSLNVLWRDYLYWGRHPTFTLPTNAEIIASDGAGVGTGKQFRTNFQRSFNGIDGNGEFLFFAWPSSFGNPTFLVNGLPSTAFTKVGDQVSFINESGFQSDYDVWISNTAQNSPISSFEIL